MNKKDRCPDGGVFKELEDAMKHDNIESGVEKAMTGNELMTLPQLYECHKADILLTHDGGGQSAWEDVTDHFGIRPPKDGKRLWLVYEHQPLNYPSLYCWLEWLDGDELNDRLDQLHDWKVVRRTRGSSN